MGQGHARNAVSTRTRLRTRKLLSGFHPRLEGRNVRTPFDLKQPISGLGYSVRPYRRISVQRAGGSDAAAVDGQG